MMLSQRSSMRGIAICLRRYSAQVPPTPSVPPILLKVRNDLKTAMKARDSARLDVLRGIIAETTNAAKTSTPVSTDSHMLQIIHKKILKSRDVLAEVEQAHRADLKEKELAQIQVLEEYVQGSGVMSEEDVKIAIQQLIGTMRTEGHSLNKSKVIGQLLGPGGAFENQLVDKKEVVKIVEGML